MCIFFNEDFIQYSNKWRCSSLYDSDFFVQTTISVEGFLTVLVIKEIAIDSFCEHNERYELPSN